MLIAYIFFYQDIKRSYMTFKINIETGYLNLATCTDESLFLFKAEHSDYK